jgi:hypothetical protein
MACNTPGHVISVFEDTDFLLRKRPVVVQDKELGEKGKDI